MPKISWNDIDDEDSSLSSEEQEIQKRIPQSKTASSISKLKNACDQMSLKKLQNHQHSDVWLYIPNSFYEKGDEVHSILDKNQKLKRVNRIKTVGWNVLTSRQIGRSLIQQGLQEGDIFIKFIYSNRNEQKMNYGQQKTKLQKKVTYVQKNSKPANEQKAQQQESNKGQKKKVKYIQKSRSMIAETANQSASSSINQQNITKSTQDYKSPQKWSSSNNFKSPKKYKLKQEISRQQQSKDIKGAQQTEILSQSLNKIQSKDQSIVSIPAEDEQVKNVEQNKDEIYSDSSAQKQQKKKKKRKTKKNKQGKPQKIDQNPYSYFMK